MPQLSGGDPPGGRRGPALRRPDGAGGIWVKAGGEWEVIRRCRRCGQLESGPVAAGDNPIKLLSIASKPLSQPPFPIERLEELTRCMEAAATWEGLAMNRENKRKRYSKGYFKTHPATDAFTCKGCGRLVVPEGAGSSHRNHCPYCLHSLHLDEEPGDRASTCHGRMEPVGVWVRKNGEWAILHRCTRCGTIHSNRVPPTTTPWP